MVGEALRGGPMRGCWFAGLVTLLIGCGGATDPVEATPPVVVAAPAAPVEPPPPAAPPAPEPPPPAPPPEDLLANLDAIRLAEGAHAMVLGRYLALPSWPRAAEAVDAVAVPWAEQESWKKLGWSPEGPVRGAYRVELRGGGYVATGTIDADGDGVPATAVATHRDHAKWTSAAGVR